MQIKLRIVERIKEKEMKIKWNNKELKILNTFRLNLNNGHEISFHSYY